VAWVEPVPDGLVFDERGDPVEVAAVRQTVRLALIAAAQILPPRQRATFFLCDVLDQSGAEAADVLGMSVPLHANGQLAAAAYHRGGDGGYHPFAIVVLTTTRTHLTRIALFAQPALFIRFELPPAIAAGHDLGSVA
jgi:Sigma-70, region 4